MEQNVFEMFNEYQDLIEEEQVKRDSYKLLCRGNERLAREITTSLHSIHRHEESIAPMCQKARESFAKAKEGYQKLKEAVPRDEYYNYHELWREMTEKYCYLITLTVWLEEGTLASHEMVSQILGISHKDDEFHVELEDYLVGVFMLCTELVRHARLIGNGVSHGAYKRALEIHNFAMEIDAGFSLLNLYTENLRKRYETFESDLKKIEEVVFDISVRGFVVHPRPEDEKNVPTTNGLDH